MVVAQQGIQATVRMLWCSEGKEVLAGEEGLARGVGLAVVGDEGLAVGCLRPCV